MKPTIEIQELFGEHQFPPMTRFRAVIMVGLVVGVIVVIVFGVIRTSVPWIFALSIILLVWGVSVASVVDDVYSSYIITAESFSKYSPIKPLGWVLPTDDIRVIEVEGHWPQIHFLIRCFSGEMKSFLAPPSMAKVAVEGGQPLCETQQDDRID